MATPVIMPRQGQSLESCVIGQWLKKLGDKVAVGDELFTYKTDKAIFDEAAKVEGELLAILSLSGILCLRHNMSKERNMYAKQEEGRYCGRGGVAADSVGMA